MKLVTSLQLCKDQYACLGSWNKLFKHLKGDLHKKIPIIDIIDILNIKDAIWALRAVPESQKKARDKIARLFACDCAEHALPIYEKAFPDDKKPRETIKIARAFANGNASIKELVSAWDSAREAARASAWVAAWEAARASACDAACDSACDSAWDATWDAVRASAWDAVRASACDSDRDSAWASACDSARDWQRKNLTKYLKVG